MTEITSRLSTSLADRYRIERHLGEGGMASVYLAEDLKHKRHVALKVLKPDLAAVLGADRFIQEITTTASLQHPHILPLFDSGETDGFLYYVMPYIEGETLRDKLNRETQLGVDEAVRITLELADALDYAHRHNVIHRDIKPENILLHDGRPMLADFGIALAVSAAAGGRMTETGMSLGTPHYMSPEQATADKDLTNRSDIYSLGSVLYEMLTGEPPHVGGSAQAVIMKIVTDDARPVTELRKSVPPHVAAATAKSLQRLAADRFESAARFAEALTNEAYVSGATTTAAPSAAAAAADWRARAAVPLIALAVVLAVASVLGWIRPRAADAPVVRYQLVFPRDEPYAINYGPGLTLSPDGSVMVYASTTDRGLQLRVRARDALTSELIPGTEGAWQPFFAPDGRRVAFITGQRELKVVSLTGEPPLTIADSGLWRNGGTWGYDGFLYVGWQSHSTVISRIPVGGGPAEPVTALDSTRGEVSHAFPEALPSGKGVLFTTVHTTNQASERDEVAVVDLRTGEHRPLVQGILGRYLDGYLVFVRFDGALLAAPFDVDALELTGPTVPLLSGFSVEAGPDVALSASGRLAYALTGSAAAPATVTWFDRTGVARPAEAGWSVVPAQSSGPVVSPDGQRVALSVVGGEGADIWIKDLDGGPFTRLTFDGNSYRPSWHPDGSEIVYRSVQPPLSYDLFIKRADGSGPARVLLDPTAEINEGSFSPDGEWVVVSTVGGDQLAARLQGDSALSPILDESFSEFGAVLSPNGRWLAYVSDESGRPEVYVRSFPNVADIKQQVSTDGGVEPHWAHSGRELFYKSPARDLISARVRADDAFAILDRERLFTFDAARPNDVTGARYDVSPDDQFFLTFTTEASAQGPGTAIVVENFVDELRRKMAANR